MTGRQLAESLSWPPSKISKLENARQTPTDDDIRAWTAATGSGEETDALLASLHTLETQYAEWRRILRGGLAPHQAELIELSQRTRLLRAFELSVVPGLLQTAGYARACMAAGAAHGLQLPDDIDVAVQRRMQRQEVLYHPDKRFHFVLTEAALRFRLCEPAVMMGQLDRLVSLTSLPNVKLGVIAFGARYTAPPQHAFWIYDDEKVRVETYSAELDLQQPQEIELYATVFENLAAVASYGRAARAIITQAIDDLAPDVPEDSG